MLFKINDDIVVVNNVQHKHINGDVVDAIFNIKFIPIGKFTDEHFNILKKIHNATNKKLAKHSNEEEFKFLRLNEELEIITVDSHEDKINENDTTQIEEFFIKNKIRLSYKELEVLGIIHRLDTVNITSDILDRYIRLVYGSLDTRTILRIIRFLNYLGVTVIIRKEGKFIPKDTIRYINNPTDKSNKFKVAKRHSSFKRSNAIKGINLNTIDEGK